MGCFCTIRNPTDTKYKSFSKLLRIFYLIFKGMGILLDRFSAFIEMGKYLGFSCFSDRRLFQHFSQFQ